MTTAYRAERRVFDRLVADCTEQARQEYEDAVAILAQRYNTTIYENRFVVGGAVEVFTYALLKTVGIDCTLYGDQSAAGDILLPGDHKLSVKSRFTRTGPITLANKRGQGARVWQTATLFVLCRSGHRVRRAGHGGREPRPRHRRRAGVHAAGNSRAD